ncbi:hypothetical protein PIROE2DRAFT_7567, partial [Piromyces sp. E2]
LTVPTVVSCVEQETTPINTNTLQQNNSIALDSTINNISIINQDVVVPGSNSEAKSVDTNLPSISLTPKTFQNTLNKENSNNHTILNNNTLSNVNNTILNNTLNVNNTTLYNSSNDNNNTIINNNNIVNITNDSDHPFSLTPNNIAQNVEKQINSSFVNNNYTITNNSYVNNLTFPIISTSGSIPLASSSQIISEPLNIDNSKHYHSLINVDQSDNNQSSFSFNDINKTSNVHFSPSFSHVNPVNSSKTSLRKKHSSFSALSDLFNYKLTPKATSVKSNTSKSGESQKKMDTTTSSSIFSEFKNSLKKSDTFSFKYDSSDKKKKKRRSYMQILCHSKSFEKGNMNYELNNSNMSLPVINLNDLSFSKTTDPENINNYQKNSKKEKSRKNKRKIKIGFRRMKISKNHKQKKFDKRSNSSVHHHSIHRSKPTLENSSLSSGGSNHRHHHRNVSSTSTSFEYKISLSHGRHGHLTKNGNIQDDPYYSFSEDVFNSLSNIEKISTNHPSFNHQSMILPQNSQIIPSRTSSHSVLYNSSSFILPSSIPRNPDTLSISQKIHLNPLTSSSHSHSKSSVLSEQSVSQPSNISGMSLENEIIKVKDHHLVPEKVLHSSTVKDSKLNNSQLFFSKPSSNTRSSQDFGKEISNPSSNTRSSHGFGKENSDPSNLTHSSHDFRKEISNPSNLIHSTHDFRKENQKESIIEPTTSESISSRENHNKELLNWYQQDQSLACTPLQMSNQFPKRQNSNEIRNQRLQVLRQQRRRPLLTPSEKGEIKLQVTSSGSVSVVPVEAFVEEYVPPVSHSLKETGVMPEVEHLSFIKSPKDIVVKPGAVSEGPVSVSEKSQSPTSIIREQGYSVNSSSHDHLPTTPSLPSSLVRDDFMEKRILFGEEDHRDNSLHYHHSIDSHCQSIYEKYRKLSHYQRGHRLGSVEPSLSHHSSLKLSPQHSYSRNRLKSLPSDKDISISISTTSSSSLDSMYLANSNEYPLKHSSSLRTNSRMDHRLNRSASYKRAYPQSNYTSFDNVNHSLLIQQNKIKSSSQDMSPEVKPISIMSNSTTYTNTNSSSFERLARHDESYLFSSSSPQPPLLAHHASIGCISNRDFHQRPPVFRNQSVKEDSHSYHNTGGEFGCYYCQPPQEYEGEISGEGSHHISGDLLEPPPALSFSSHNPSSSSFSSSFTSFHSTSLPSENNNSIYDNSSLIIPESKLTTSVIPPSPKSEEPTQEPLMNGKKKLSERQDQSERTDSKTSNISPIIPTVVIIEENPSSTNILPIKTALHYPQITLPETEPILLGNAAAVGEETKKMDGVLEESMLIHNVLEEDDLLLKINDHDLAVNSNSKNLTVTRTPSISNTSNILSRAESVSKSVSKSNIVSRSEPVSKSNIVSRSESVSQSVSESMSESNSDSEVKGESEDIVRTKSISSESSNSKSKRYSTKTSHSNLSSSYVHSPLIIECVPTTGQEDEINLPEKGKDNLALLNDNALLNRKRMEKRAKHQSDQMYGGEIPLLKRLSFISLSKLPLKSTTNTNNEHYEYSPLLAYTSLPRYNSKRTSLDPIFSNYRSVNATSSSSIQYPSIPPSSSLSVLSTDSYRFEEDLKCLFRFNDRKADPLYREKIKNDFNLLESTSMDDGAKDKMLNRDKNYCYLNGLLEVCADDHEAMPSPSIIREFLESYSKESQQNNPFSLTNLIQMNELEMASKDSLGNDHASAYYSVDRVFVEDTLYPSLTYPLTSWEKRKALMMLSLSLRDTMLHHYGPSLYEEGSHRGKESDVVSSDMDNNSSQYMSALSSPEEVWKTWRGKEESMMNHSISIKRLSNFSKRSFPSYFKTGESRTILTNASGRIASVQTLFDENDNSRALEQLPSAGTANNECYNIEILRNDSHPTLNPQLRHITSVKTLCNTNNSNYNGSLMNIKNESYALNETSPILEDPNDKSGRFVSSSENTSSLSIIPPTNNPTYFSFVDNSVESTGNIITPELVSSPEANYHYKHTEAGAGAKVEARAEIEVEAGASKIAHTTSPISMAVPIPSDRVNTTKENCDGKRVVLDNISEFHLFEKLSASSTHTDSNEKIPLDVPLMKPSTVYEGVGENKNRSVHRAQTIPDDTVWQNQNKSIGHHQNNPDDAVWQKQKETEFIVRSESGVKEPTTLEISENELSMPTHTTTTATTGLQGNSRVMDHFSTLTTTNDEDGIRGSSITDSIQNSILEYNDMSSPSLSTINPHDTNDISFDFSRQTSFLSINLKDNHEIHKIIDISDNKIIDISDNDTDLSYILNNDSSSMDTNPQDYALERQLDNSIPLLSNKEELIELPSEIYPLEYIDIHGEVSPLKFLSVKSTISKSSNSIPQPSLLTKTIPRINTVNEVSDSSVPVEPVESRREKEKEKENNVVIPVSSKNKSKKLKHRFHIFRLCTFKHRRHHPNKNKRIGSSPNHSFILNQKVLKAALKNDVSIPIANDASSTGPTNTVDAIANILPIYLKQRKANGKDDSDLSTSLVKSNRLRKKISLQSFKSITKDKRDRFYSHHLNHSTNNLNQYIKSKLKPFDYILAGKRKTFIEKDVNNSSMVIHEETGSSTEYTGNGFFSSIKNGKSLIFKEDDDEYDENDERCKSFNRILKDFDSPSGSEFNSSSRDYSSHFDNSLTPSKQLVSSHSQSQSQLKIVQHIEDNGQKNDPEVPSMILNNEKILDIEELQEKLQVVAQNQQQEEEEEEEEEKEKKKEKQKKVSNISKEPSQDQLLVNVDPIYNLSSIKEDVHPTEESNLSFYNPDLSVFRYPPISPDISSKSSVTSISDLDDIISSIQPSFVKSTCDSEIIQHELKEELLNHEIIKVNLYEPNNTTTSKIDPLEGRNEESEQDYSIDSKLNTTLEFKRVSNSEELVVNTTPGERQKTNENTTGIESKNDQKTVIDSLIKNENENDQKTVKDCLIKNENENNQKTVKDNSIKNENNQKIMKDSSIKNENDQKTVKDSSIKNENDQKTVKDSSIKNENDQKIVKDSSIKNENDQKIVKDSSIKNENNQKTVKDSSIKNENDQKTVKDSSIKNENKEKNNDENENENKEKIKDENQNENNQKTMIDSSIKNTSEINNNHSPLKIDPKNCTINNAKRKGKENFVEEKSFDIIKVTVEENKEKSNLDLSLSNSFELTSVKALASESYPNDSQNSISKYNDNKPIKYIEDITKDTQKYIIPNQHTGHHLHHITGKIVQKFKSEISLKKKSFISLKSKANQSHVTNSPIFINADISHITLPSMTKTTTGSIHNSINYLNIDTIQSPCLSSKSCGAIELKNRKSRISINSGGNYCHHHHHHIKDRLKLKTSKRSMIESSNFNIIQNSFSNTNSKRKSNSLADVSTYNNYTLDKVIPYLLTSTSDNMNFIIHSINNQAITKMENHRISNSTSVKPHKEFSDILTQLEKENCKSSKEHCSDFVKELILDFTSKLNDFHWTYKSEKFPKHLLKRIKIKEECKKLKEKDFKEEDKPQEFDQKET